MRSRRELRAWRGTVFGIAAALLVTGLGASAAANRLVFALWGVVAAAVAVPVLRQAFEAVAPGGALLLPVAGRALPFVAVALAVFAWLVARHAHALDTGLLAVAPGGLHLPALARPATWAVLAGLLFGAGVLCRRMGRA